MEYLNAKGQLSALRRSHKKAKLRLLCREKELTLARIELMRVGVKNPGASYLGKRRRNILEGSETESAAESESGTEPEVDQE